MLITLATETNFDSRVMFRASEFERIGDEVIKYLAYHRAVCKRRRKVMQLQQKLPFPICYLDLIEDSLRQFFHIDIALLQRLTAQP